MIKFLKRNGCQIVYLEDISPREQARLFNASKLIIGPHGSGFANLVFSKANTKVIEIDHGISDTLKPRSLYRDLSMMMGCDYQPFYVDSTTEEHLEDDMLVDIEEFSNLLDN